MDRVNEQMVQLDELQGWRKPVGEELQSIQGQLLMLAKNAIKSERAARRTLLFFVYVFGAGAIKFLSYMKPTVEKGIMTDVLMLGVIILGFLLVDIFFIKSLLNSMLVYTGKLYYGAVKAGNFRVLDVQITDVKRTYSQRNLDKYYAWVSDMNNRQYGKKVYFIFDGHYEKGTGILIDIPLNTYERHEGKWYYKILRKLSKESEKQDRQVVIPCGKGNEKTWSVGLELYKKHMK